MVLLTARDDLEVKEHREESGLDFTVYVSGDKDAGHRPFGVCVEGSMTPVAIARANQQLQPTMAKIQTHGPFNYPVCVFYFTVRENQGYYTWVEEPLVTRMGSPKLKNHSEAQCRPLDRESLNEIVAAVNRWYAAFYDLACQRPLTGLFHVVEPGTNIHIFTRYDPTREGFTEVQRDVTLYDLRDDLARNEGEEYPIPILGQSRDDPRIFQIFRSADACKAAGFAPLSLHWHVCERWSDNLK